MDICNYFRPVLILNCRFLVRITGLNARLYIKKDKDLFIILRIDI